MRFAHGGTSPRSETIVDSGGSGGKPGIGGNVSTRVTQDARSNCTCQAAFPGALVKCAVSGAANCERGRTAQAQEVTTVPPRPIRSEAIARLHHGPRRQGVCDAAPD